MFHSKINLDPPLELTLDEIKQLESLREFRKGMKVEANILFLEIIQTIYLWDCVFYNRVFVSKNIIFSNVNIISSFHFNFLIDI